MAESISETWLSDSGWHDHLFLLKRRHRGMDYYARPEVGLDLSRVNEAVEAAFAAFAREETEMPPKVYVTLPGGDFRTMPAYIPALGLAGVKIVNVHPGNPTRGLETVMALIVLLDPP